MGTLSCGPLLIANLSFYSSLVLPMNPSLRSETRPHAVSISVGIPDSTGPCLSTPERGSQSSPILPNQAPSLSPRRQLQSALRRQVQATPPPTTRWSAALSLGHLGTISSALGSPSPAISSSPVGRSTTSPPGHAPRRQLLNASVRPHRRSESSLRRSESRLASTIVVVPQICSTPPPATELVLTIVIEPNEQEEVSCGLRTPSSCSPSDHSSLLLQLPHVSRCNPRFGGSRCRFHTVHSPSSFAQDCLQVRYHPPRRGSSCRLYHPACLVVMTDKTQELPKN
jgi:hypothetical protein